MSAYPEPKPAEPTGYRPTGAFPECPEGVALALLYLIIDQDRSLTSWANNLSVGAYLLDLYAQSARRPEGDRASPGSLQ